VVVRNLAAAGQALNDLGRLTFICAEAGDAHKVDVSGLSASRPVARVHDPGKIGLVARTERRRDEVHKESRLGYDHRLLRGHSRSQPSFKPS
jgi:hypothetical protein